MSDNNSNSSNWLWLFAIFLWPALAWWGDIPSHVHKDEVALATVGPWVSVLSHLAGAAWATLIFPAWGLAWALFAGLILARRLCASGREPLPLYLTHLKSVFASVPDKRILYVLVVGALSAVSTAFLPLPSFLGYVQEGLAIVGPFAIMAVMGFGAIEHKKSVLEYRHNRDAWISRFAAIFAVGTNVIAEQGGISLSDNGTVMLRPVPPIVAVKLTQVNLSAIDQQIAQVAPHLMLDTASDYEVVVLIPADDATRNRRAALAASGGLLGAAMSDNTGFGSAPISDDEPSLGSTDFSGGLFFTAEDLS